MLSFSIEIQYNTLTFITVIREFFKENNEKNMFCVIIKGTLKGKFVRFYERIPVWKKVIENIMLMKELVKKI